MGIRRLSKITLRHLILLLAVFSAAVMLAGGIAGAYQVQREQLMASTLDANEAFATKLARTISDFLVRAQNNLAYTADRVESAGMTPTVLQDEIDRLRQVEHGFNTVAVVDARGAVQAAAPASLGLGGRQLNLDRWRSLVHARVPTISRPFVTVLGNLAVMMSYPLLDASGQSRGHLAATMYLRDDGGLQRLASEQYFRDGTYVYVVDANGRLLYHPDPDRIGAIVVDNEVIQSVIAGRSGQMRVVNSQGVDMLAGYAHVPAADWGVVVQRPVRLSLQGLNDLMLRVLRQALVPALALLVILWLLSGWISRPLGELSRIVRDGYQDGGSKRIAAVHCWYQEARRLRAALLAGDGQTRSQIGALHDAAHTDPLTGLGNRRGLESALKHLEALGQSFAVVALDIDFFKRINDRYGHDVGDQAIVGLARLMQAQARQGDGLFRLGGEEFLVILPGIDVAGALGIAERLRVALEGSGVLHDDVVTLSAGVAVWETGDTESTLKAADQALYRAKQAGRNRVEAADTDIEETIAAG